LLRLGIHDFLNASPILLILKEQGPDLGFQVVTDSPAALADRLNLGDLDLAMIPSVEYFKSADNYRLVPNICIASRGQVRTVLLLAKKPISEITSIAADIRSRTSVALLKILFPFNDNLSIHPSSPDPESMLAEHQAALIIGDPAFKLNKLSSDITVYDLSEEWFKQTGKSFVHAVLAVSEKVTLNESQKNLFQIARVEGCRRIKEIVSNYKNLPDVDNTVLEDYLENKIRYDLDDEGIDGLNHFINLCYQNGVISKKIFIRFI
jgi:chorismate dehydratase